MICQDPSDTSRLMEIITNLISEKKQGNFKTQGYHEVTKKSGRSPVKKMQKMININLRSTKETTRLGIS